MAGRAASQGLLLLRRALARGRLFLDRREMAQQAKYIFCMGLFGLLLSNCLMWIGGSGAGGGEEEDAPWELVEDSKGFRTYASRVPGSSSLSLRGETVVDEHIGRLYTAFLNTSSTLDWVRFLVEVEELPAVAVARGGGGEGNGVLFQMYDMPWPVKDREVVLRRNVRLDKRARKMIATYQSTEHPARPTTSAAVRAIVHRTSWILTSLGGSRTAIDFETRTDPKGSLPSAVVGFMQMKFPRETVAGFVKSARGVKVHPAMTKW